MIYLILLNIYFSYKNSEFIILNPAWTIMNKFLLILILLSCTLTAQATSFTNVRSGSWYDPTIWDSGTLPTKYDIVTIAAGTTVSVFGDYTDCDGLIVNGFLDIGATNLTVGGRDLQIDERAVRNASCIINGNLRVTGDWTHQFKIYGHIKFNTGSTFEMTQGTIMIDGSGFTEALSIPAHIPLLDVTDASSFVSTGGLIVMFNPHYHATGLTIKGAKHIHSVSFGNTLELLTFACRHTSDFLISETDKPIIDNVRLAYLPNPSRQNQVVLNNYSVAGNLQLDNGVLVGTGNFKVAGNILLDTFGRIERDIECNGPWQQNISTFKGNTSATIKGNIYINNPDRVQMLIDLRVLNGTVKMVRGKLDLNDRIVSVATAPTGASTLSYIVTHNQYSRGGALIIKNLVGRTLFPIGTESAYLPVALTAPSGDFSVSARPLSIFVPWDKFSISNQWDINRVAGTASTDVEVQWNTTNENPSFSLYRENARLHRFDGSAWQPLSNLSAPVLNSPIITGVAQNVQSFSTFTVLTQQAPLIPVTLKSFVGKAVANDAHLSWETATELNNKGFDIEKSTNGRDFTFIGFVKGGGNSAKLNTYNFVDADFNQTAYYRLKQIDFDGKYTYSPTVSLQKTREKSGVKIYPNPISNNSLLTIDLPESNQNATNIAIFETNGRLLYQNTEGVGLVKIPVNDWSKGLYFIRLTANDGKTTVTKFVKN
jgi:hypothetical protein